MRHYYAIEYAYGEHVINNGIMGDSIKRFRSREERDQWISKGYSSFTGRGHRAALRASDSRVRTMNRQVAKGLLAWEDEEL